MARAGRKIDSWKCLVSSDQFWKFRRFFSKFVLAVEIQSSLGSRFASMLCFVENFWLTSKFITKFFYYSLIFIPKIVAIWNLETKA